MKLNPLRYVSESIPHRGTPLLGDAESAWDAAAAGAAVVRSSMTGRALADPALDLASIEREARAAQSAWIANALKSALVALVRKLSGKASASTDDRPTSVQSIDGSGNPADKAPLPRSVAQASSGATTKATTERVSEWSAISARLDAVQMSDYDRWQAKESLHNAERFVEFVLPIALAIDAIGQSIEHAFLGLAHGIKAIFAKPVKH